MRFVAKGMPFILSPPAVWLERLYMSGRGLDYIDCRSGLWKGDLWDGGSNDDKSLRTAG